MRAMLKTELYKTVRSRYPYVLSGLFTVAVIARELLSAGIGGIADSTVSLRLLEAGIMPFFLIRTWLMTRSDSRGGFWKNLVSIPHYRGRIVAAKSLLSAAESLIWILWGVGVSVLTRVLSGAGVGMTGEDVPFLAALWGLVYTLAITTEGVTFLWYRNEVPLIAAAVLAAVGTLPAVFGWPEESFGVMGAAAVAAAVITLGAGTVVFFKREV